MKNLIVTFAVVMSMGLTSSFAAVSTSDPVIETNFARQFTGAEDVKWTSIEHGMKKVSFTLGGTRTEAYYNVDGELLGTLRNLFYSQLPLSVMQTINNKFDGGVVIEILEITNNEGTSYRVILEQKDKKYKIRVNSVGEITEQEKMKLKN